MTLPDDLLIPDYNVPPEYKSPTLTPPSTKKYIYRRELTRGTDGLNMGFLLACGKCGYLIDLCEPYWISNLEHRCYHTCCITDGIKIDVVGKSTFVLTACGCKPCATN